VSEELTPHAEFDNAIKSLRAIIQKNFVDGPQRRKALVAIDDCAALVPLCRYVGPDPLWDKRRGWSQGRHVDHPDRPQTIGWPS